MTNRTMIFVMLLCFREDLQQKRDECNCYDSKCPHVSTRRFGPQIPGDTYFPTLSSGISFSSGISDFNFPCRDIVRRPALSNQAYIASLHCQGLFWGHRGSL